MARLLLKLFVVCVLFMMCTADETLRGTLVMVCGRTLSTLIFTICADTGLMKELADHTLNLKLGRKPTGIFAEKDDAVREGVVPDCCLHPCTMARLVTYCPEIW